MTAEQRATEHGTAKPVEIIPVTGLGEFRPGDDLAAAIAGAARWLRDDDVVVITSKVLSKTEGRIVAAPTDPEQRDLLRRKLIDDEAVRVLARKGKTFITENAIGLVQAAAGVDGSNIDSGELALLPVDPDGSAARCATVSHGSWAYGSASSSPTPWGGPGATARPMSRSARPV